MTTPPSPVLEAAYRAYIVHIQGCATCRTTGTNCAEGADLRAVYQAAEKRPCT